MSDTTTRIYCSLQWVTLIKEMYKVSPFFKYQAFPSQGGSLIWYGVYKLEFQLLKLSHIMRKHQWLQNHLLIIKTLHRWLLLYLLRQQISSKYVKTFAMFSQTPQSYTPKPDALTQTHHKFSTSFPKGRKTISRSKILNWLVEEEPHHADNVCWRCQYASQENGKNIYSRPRNLTASHRYRC